MQALGSGRKLHTSGREFGEATLTNLFIYIHTYIHTSNVSAYAPSLSHKLFYKSVPKSNNKEY